MRRSESRQRHALPIKVRVTPDEKAQLQATAKACSCSVPFLLRQLGLGHPVPSTVDQQFRVELITLHGDLGRVGGLLKLWLTQDSRAWDGTGVTRAEIRALVQELADTQQQIKAAILRL